MIHHDSYTEHGLFETYGAVDITKAGSYAYINGEGFLPLLLAWSIDGGEVQQIDFTRGEALHPGWISILNDPDYQKIAWNVTFEREVFRSCFRIDSPIEQWSDTMVWSRYAGYPGGLDAASKALGLPEDKAKMAEGKKLIQFFCKPFKGLRRDPSKYPERWELFKQYNRRDVEAEMEIRKIIGSKVDFPKREQTMWEIDQKINDQGILIDEQMAKQAIQMANRQKEKLVSEAVAITRLDNPNSVQQLKDWLGLDEDQTLRKKDVAEMLGTVTDDQQKRVLQIRQELGKSSVKKYDAMVRSACPDGRVRGSLQFYGAGRTGRWAGRLIQPQNYPQNHIGDGSMRDLEYARKLVKEGDDDGIELLFGSVNDTLSQLTRTALIPSPGNRFVVADFNAIEARVIAWLADEKWRIKTFADGKDIYCASASQMFHVPVEKHGVNGHLRQKGKIAELALGYGGGVGALTAMGALDMGLTEEELPDIVSMWREASPRIVKLWYTLGDAVMKVTKGEDNFINIPRLGQVYMSTPEALSIKLPSGRYLYYIKPQIGLNKFGGESFTYMGLNLGKWTRLESFGGKIVENCIQSIARDCLCTIIHRVAKRLNLYPVTHIHDEIVLEAPEAEAEETLQKVLAIMAEPISWAPGLTLKGAGYCCPYYYKD